MNKTARIIEFPNHTDDIQYQIRSRACWVRPDSLVYALVYFRCVEIDDDKAEQIAGYLGELALVKTLFVSVPQTIADVITRIYEDDALLNRCESELSVENALKL